MLGAASTLSAQGFEITPIGGYRFGNDFFEILTRRPLDIDGAPAIGVVVDIPTSEDFQIEGLYSHQHATALVPVLPAAPPVSWQFDVDHWQAGGLRLYDIGRPRVQPFLTGTLGLTRYASDTQSEIRFTLGAGGGVKLMPSRHIGVRLDGRGYMTFADADVSLFACSTLSANPGCLVAFNANLVWQAEFTAGVVFRF